MINWFESIGRVIQETLAIHKSKDFFYASVAQSGRGKGLKIPQVRVRIPIEAQ